MTPDPYGRIVLLARRELDLVLSGDYGALAALGEERSELVATLPAVAPEWARPALREAARLQSRTTAALEAARARLLTELSAVDRGRRGYSRLTPAAAPSFDHAA